MNFTDKTETLDRLLKMIKCENTGTAQKLSFNLRVSERTLRRYIEELRNLGHQISYSTFDRTYYYIDKTESKK